MMGDKEIPDTQSRLEQLYILTTKMLERELKWNDSNKNALIVSMKKLAAENSYVSGEQRYKLGLSLNNIQKRLDETFRHTNKSLKPILGDLLLILEEIKDHEIKPLASFNEFAEYIIRHKIIATNKKKQYARIKYSHEQLKLLSYGIAQNWDRDLVQTLIEKHKNTDEFELFKVEDKDHNTIFIFYRFYEENLQAIKSDITYRLIGDKKTLIMKIPLYKAQIDLFEYEIKNFASEEIQRYYKDKYKEDYKPRPVIERVEQYILGFNKIATKIHFLYWNLDKEDRREIDNKDGYSIML